MKKNSSEYSIKTKLLYKFLKRKRSLNKYVDNVIKQHSPKYNEKTKAYIDNKNLLQLIEGFGSSIDLSFYWNNTLEGHDFWEDMDDEFENEYYPNNSIYTLYYER
jgi:hypothetical protein